MKSEGAFDPVLESLRNHVRTQRADDAALESVARGEGATAEVVDLERRAVRDPELADMIALSRPLSDDVVSRIEASALLSLQPLTPMSAQRSTTSRESLESAFPRRKVVPFMRRAAPVAGSLAVAAAVLLWTFAGRNEGRSAPPLPDYDVSVSAEQAMRGPAPDSSPARLVLRPGDNPFEMIVRPATATAVKIAVYAFAMGEREPNPIEATIEIAPEGSVRIRGKSRALDGAREVRVVIGDAGMSFKRFDDALARAREGTSDASVRVLTVPIDRD